MKKRIVSLLLTMTMVVSMCLSGCGNSKQEESKTPASSSSKAEASESSSVVESEPEVQLEEKTIQVWLGGPGKQKDSDKVWEKFNEMLQDYVPNTTVEFTVMTTAEYGTHYEQMLASGEEVDLAWVASWVTGATNTNIEDGNWMLLDDLLTEYGSGIVDEIGQNVVDRHRTADGELYYLPSWQGLTTGLIGTYVIKEIAEGCGGDAWYEETQAAITEWWNVNPSAENFQKVLDQFELYLAAAKEKGMLYAGATASRLVSWNYMRNIQDGPAAEWAAPQRMDNTFTIVDAGSTEHYQVYLATMADWYKKGYIRSDIASMDTSQIHFVKNGEFDDNTNIMWTDNYLTESQLKSREKDAGMELYGFHYADKGYLGKGDATAMAIPYCADEPERAMMVLEAIYTVPELYQLLIYGIPGEHYTENGDGTITTSYGAEGTADADYGLWRWTIGTCKNSLVTQADTAGYYDELAANDEVAYIRQWENWSFDWTGLEDVKVALQATRSEYEPILERGYMGDDWKTYYDKFMEERKAAGIDKVIAEMEKQFGEYLKKYNITSW